VFPEYKDEKNHIIIFLIFLLFLVINFFNGCAQREHLNPFDPLGPRKSPITLSLVPINSGVELYWTTIELEGVVGFRIYRKKQNQSFFEPIIDLSADQHSYIDKNVETGQWYNYYVTVLGKNIESSASNIEKVLLGPGEYWILSQYGYSINHYSYDLLHRKNTINVKFAPEDWDWNLKEQKVYLAYPQYRLVSCLDLNSGIEDVFFDDIFIRPIHLKWDFWNNRLLVLDRKKQSVFIFVNTVLVDSIPLPDENYLKIQTTKKGHIWVLGIHNALVFDKNGLPISQINFNTNFTGMDIQYDGYYIYVLTTNMKNGFSNLFQFEETTRTVKVFSIKGNFSILRKIPDKNYFWAAEKLTIYNQRLVKLSNVGHRLLEGPELENIFDIQINPRDESVVVVDRLGNSLYLFDREGNLISNKVGIYDPIKVIIR